MIRGKIRAGVGTARTTLIAYICRVFIWPFYSNAGLLRNWCCGSRLKWLAAFNVGNNRPRFVPRLKRGEIMGKSYTMTISLLSPTLRLSRERLGLVFVRVGIDE